MLGDLMKSEWFHFMFSLLVGIGIVAILRPTCSGDKCSVTKAPPPADWNGYVYQMGAKCYEFKTGVVDCPKAGGGSAAIESFSSCGLPASRNSHLRFDASF
jgi:hypothetical protein